MKFLSFLKTNLKFIIPIIIIIILATGYFVFFFNKTTSKSDIEYINLAKNYQFCVPENYDVFPDSNPKTLIIMPESVEQFNHNHYQSMLEKGGILIQSYTQFNKNDGIFEEYIKQQYKSDDQRDIDVNFEEINENRVANIKVDHKESGLQEYIKIINSYYPVLVVGIGPSEELSAVVKSIIEVDERNKDYYEIINQIRLIGALLKVNMSEEIYSLFTEEYKNKLNENEFKEIFKKSEKMCQQRSINFIGGEFNNKNKQFSMNLIMVDPDNQRDYGYSPLVLKKEQNQWLINEIRLPENEPESNIKPFTEGDELPEGVTQEDIDKALEKNDS